MVKIGVVMLD